MNTQRHHTENNDPKVVVNRAQHKQRGELLHHHQISLNISFVSTLAKAAAAAYVAELLRLSHVIEIL